jgi:hypothetical protein
LAAVQSSLAHCCESFPVGTEGASSSPATAAADTASSSLAKKLQALQKSLTDAITEAEARTSEASALAMQASSVSTASGIAKASAAAMMALLPKVAEALDAFAAAAIKQKERAELAESTLEKSQDDLARISDEASKAAEDARNREAAMQAGWKEKETKIASIFNQLNDKLKAERESSKALQQEMETIKESLKKAVEAAAEAKKLAAKALKEKNDAILVATAAAKDAEAVKRAIAEATAKQAEAEALAAEKEKEAKDAAAAAAAMALAAAQQQQKAANATAADDPAPVGGRTQSHSRSRSNSLSDTLSAILGGGNEASSTSRKSSFDEALGIMSSGSANAAASTAVIPAAPAAPVDALSFVGPTDSNSMFGNPSAGLGPAGASSAFNILADPTPGRIYVIVMGVRHLPQSGFGSFGTKSAYAKLSLPDQSERQTRPSDVIDKGPTRGLCAAFNQVHVFKATRALEALPLTKDQRLGSAVLDLSPSGEWARQPHACWLLLHPPSGGASSDSSSDAAFLKPDPAEILVPVAPNCKLPLGPGAAGGANLPGGSSSSSASSGSTTGSGSSAGGRLASSLHQTFSAQSMSAFGMGSSTTPTAIPEPLSSGPDYSSASSSNPVGPLSNTTTQSQAAASVDFDINAMIAANQQAQGHAVGTSVAIASSATQRHHIVRPSVTSGGTGFGFIAGATPGGVFANSNIAPARGNLGSAGSVGTSPYGAARNLTVSGRWAMPELPIPPVDGNKPAVLVQVIYSPNGDELRPNGPHVAFHLPQMMGGGPTAAASAALSSATSSAILTPLPSISEKSPVTTVPAVPSASTASVGSTMMAAPPHAPPPVVAVPSSSSAPSNAAAEAELGNLRAVVADQKTKLDRIARAYKELREEKVALEAKVKSLTEECESLKRSLGAGASS